MFNIRMDVILYYYLYTQDLFKGGGTIVSSCNLKGATMCPIHRNCFG